MYVVGVREDSTHGSSITETTTGYDHNAADEVKHSRICMYISVCNIREDILMAGEIKCKFSFKVHLQKCMHNGGMTFLILNESLKIIIAQFRSGCKHVAAAA